MQGAKMDLFDYMREQNMEKESPLILHLPVPWVYIPEHLYHIHLTVQILLGASERRTQKLRIFPGNLINGIIGEYKENKWNKRGCIDI